jgi:DNA-binding NtrC family response regulator
MSAVGEGTTVELYLPRSLQAAQPTTEPRKDSRTAAGRRQARILVVDDHEEVREVIAAHLEALGYQPVQAATGRTALAILGGNCTAFDLLIADYAMPEISGIELARAVRELCPDLPAIIVTGYADVSGLDGASEDATLLHKPFRMNELGATVERALRGAADRGTAAKVVPLSAARAAQRR